MLATGGVFLILSFLLKILAIQYKLDEKYLRGKLNEKYLRGKLDEKYLPGKLDEKYLPGKLDEKYLPGKLDEKYLPGKADDLGSSCMAAEFGKLSTQKNTKNLRKHQIYIKMQKFCDFITFVCHKIYREQTAGSKMSILAYICTMTN